MEPISPHLPVHNRLLSVLPENTLASLEPHAEIHAFERGNVLLHAGHKIDRCYFPLNGLISILSVTSSGKSVEVGHIGVEGFVGFSLLFGRNEMPYEALAQSSLECVAVRSDVILDLFNTNSEFHDAVLRFSYVIIKQLVQTCICNHFHTMESRICRWLTVMYERSGSGRMRLTQEFLAEMLGVQRTSIGLVTSSMQRAGIIRYSRGVVEVLDVERMKKLACECYLIVKAEQHRLLADLGPE